jgi:hypothetical protein
MKNLPPKPVNACCAMLLLGWVCAGCSTVNSDGSVHQAAPLLGTKELQLTSAFALRPEVILLGIAAYVIVDPLAPNWKIVQTEPAPGEIHLALKKKGITNDAGGDGEARVVFLRRAATLARERGTAGTDVQGGYTVLEFNEGIESEFPFARRVAHGIVQIAGDRRQGSTVR